MKFYSEKTKKFYETMDKALAAEKEFDVAEQQKIAAQEAEKKRVAELKEKRASRAKEIEDLLKQKADLEKNIDAKLKAFTKDYGCFHRTYRISDFSEFSDWVNSFFGLI